jgi:(2Fe-2S) ferredoxin
MGRSAGKAALIITAIIPALVLVLSGCATAPPGSGFLGDYSKLHEDRYGDRSLRWYEKENFNWNQYRKIMLDPVVVYYHPEAKYRQIDPEAVRKLTEYFRKVVEEELAEEYPIVTAPGPDVLRIRAAITEIVPANPGINVVTTAAVFVPLDMGGAAIEEEFLDSQTNEVMAAMVDKKMGNPLDPRFYRGFTTMGYARGAFQAWAGELKKALRSDP